MAHPSVLAKTGAIERDEAVRILQELLPADEYPDVHDNILAAQRDVVGRSDPGFQLAVLVGAMARIIEAQDARIREIEAALPRREKGAKATK
jgi:hypothetical protein